VSKPKPCPFCGDTEAFPTHCDPNCCDSVRWYECKCGAMASNEFSWNTRPLEDAKDAKIQKLREENQRLKEKLDCIAEYGTKEINAAVELRQKLASKDMEIERLNEIIVDHLTNILLLKERITECNRKLDALLKTN